MSFIASEIIVGGPRKTPFDPLVKVTNPHRERWFGVGVYSQRQAETAVCRLPQIEPTDVVFAHRRLTPTEIERLGLERGKLSRCSFLEEALLPDKLDQKNPASTKQRLPSDGLFKQGRLGVIMHESNLEMPTELRELVVRSVDQAEKAFSFFFNAAKGSLVTVPHPAMTLSASALSFIEHNIKAVFDHARKIVQATDPQEAMRIQSEFLKSQFTTVDEHVRKIAGEIAPDKDVLAR